MTITRLDCIKPKVRDGEAAASTETLPSKIGHGVPRLDIARLNPVGWLLNTRMLAPGAPEVQAPKIGPVHASRSLMLDHVHCELTRGRAAVAGKRCIVVFHGNRDAAASAIHAYANLRTYGDIIAVNAPGYGRTPAPRNHRQLEWQMAVNVRRLVDYLQQHYQPENVVWLGFSLGSSQAAMGFSEMPGSHLLLEAPFTNVRALVEKHIGIMPGATRSAWWAGVLTGCGMAGLPKGWRVPGSAFLTDGLDTEAKLRRCAKSHPAAGSKLGIVFAEHDELMSPEMPRQLWEAYHGEKTAATADPTRVHCLLGQGHNGSYSDNFAVRKVAYRNHCNATAQTVAALLD